MAIGEYERIAYKSRGNSDGNVGNYSTVHLYPTYPSGINAGDMLVLYEIHRSETGAYKPGESISGWTVATYAYGNGGLGTDPYYTQGHVFGTVYYKIANGTESGSVDVSYTGGPILNHFDGMTAYIFCFSKPPDSDWDTPRFQTNVDSIAGTSWNAVKVAGDSIPSITSDDLTIAFSGINSYTGSGFPAETTYSSHQLHGSSTLLGVEIIGEAEGNLSTWLGSGLKAVVTIMQEYGTITDTANWNYTMSASNSLANNQCGFTILMNLSKTTWQRKLRRYTGAPNYRWNYSQMKHYYSGSFINVDNGVGTGKILKKWNGSTWEKVSALYLAPDTGEVNNHIITATNVAQSKTFVLNTGNFVRVVIDGGGSPSTQSWVSMPNNVFYSNQQNFNGPSTVTLAIAANDAGASARTGNIFLTLEDGYYIYDTIVVNQDEGPAASVDITTSSFDITEYDAGSPPWGHNPGTTTIEVTANIPWTPSLSGSGSPTVYISSSGYYDNSHAGLNYNGWFTVYGQNTGYQAVGGEVVYIASGTYASDVLYCNVV